MGSVDNEKAETRAGGMKTGGVGKNLKKEERAERKPGFKGKRMGSRHSSRK